MATYYIHSSGNDTTGNGSYATPWRTLSKAVTTSTSGDTIVLKNGTFTVGTELANNQSIANRTIQGETAGSVTVDGNGNQTAALWTYTGNGTTTIKDIVFTNWNLNSTSNGVGLIVGQDVTNTSILNIQNCIFKSIRLQINGSIQNGIISGVQGFRATITITGCLFYLLKKITLAGAGYIISLRDFLGTINGTNNTFYLDATGADFVAGILIYGGSTLTTVFKNNIFMNNSGSSAAIFSNNFGTAATNTYTNNCANGTWSGTPSGANNITTDPLFVDVANANFNLRPTSPCLDTGTI